MIIHLWTVHWPKSCSKFQTLLKNTRAFITPWKTQNNNHGKQNHTKRNQKVSPIFHLERPYPNVYREIEDTASGSNKNQTMFSFFTKKEFLIDHLEGFVDIHNHILPGIDDGAKTVEESIELIKGFGKFGVTDFICTPHIMENYYPNTHETINSSLAILENGLKINNLDEVKVRVAAEHMIDSGFEENLEKNKILRLAKSYILIEMSYLQPSLNILSAAEKIKDNMLYPILAHPERYSFLHGNPKTYEIYKKEGMLMQLNMLSLSNYYGKEVRKMSMKLLELNLIDFIASDVHNIRQLNALKEITLNASVIEKVVPLIEKTSNSFRS